MLTKTKLELYGKYYFLVGNPPGLSKEQQNLIDGVFDKEDWRIIADLLYDVYLVNKGLASESFSTEVRTKIKRECDSDDTENYLTHLSKETHG